MTHSHQTNLMMAGIAAIAVFYATESQAADINVPKITVAPTTVSKLPKSAIDLAKVKAPAPTTITVPVMPQAATTMTVAPALKATSPAIQATLEKIRKVVPQATPKSKAALAVPQRHTPTIANAAAAARNMPSGRTVDAKAIERVQQVDKRLLGGKFLQGDLAKNQIVALPEQVPGKAQRPDPVSGALPERQNTALAGGSSLAALPAVKPVIGIASVNFANRTVGGLQDPKQQTLAVYNNDPAAIAMARNAWISIGSDDSTGKFVKQAVSTAAGFASSSPGLIGAVGKAVSSVVNGVSAAQGVAEDQTQGLIDLGVSQATTIGGLVLEAGAATGAAGLSAPVAAGGGATITAGAAGAAVLASAGAGYALGKGLDELLGINEALKEAAKPDDATNVRGLNPGRAGATGTGTGSQPTPATDPESGSQPSGAETAAADNGGACGVNMSCPDDPPDNDSDQSDAGSEDDSDGGDSSASDDDDGSADASDDDDTPTADAADASDDDDTATTTDEEEDTYCGAEQDDCGGPTLTVEEMEAWGIIARHSENWDQTPNPEANPVREIDPIEAEGLMAAATIQRLGLVTTPNPEGGSSAPMPELTEEERAEYQRQMRERQLAPRVYPSPEDN